jgi:sugar diacid utilization regulator
VAALDTESKSLLPDSLLAGLARRRAGLARHMARAVVTEVKWDASTGVPPEPAAIARACEAGLDLFLATAREARPPTPEELRRVAQLGILQARGSQSVEPVLAAYRIAARVAWDAIFGAWRNHPEATPEAMVVTANYVFTALDQVAAEVTHTYLVAREQHMQRGTRARARLFHALISDTFDSELAVQKQALALNQALAAGYVAVIFKLLLGKAESERGGETLLELAAVLDLPPRALAHAADPQTLVVLWPADGVDPGDRVRDFAARLQAEAEQRFGRGRARLRAGLGSFHPGLRGISRSYLEAQQAVDVGRKLKPEGGIQHHDELVPYLVLVQNPLLAERYVTRLLGRLLAAERPGKGSLLETLDAYLTRGSVKDTAEALKLHRHTVLYRLEKIRELVDGKLDDPGVKLRLQLALELRKLL